MKRLSFLLAFALACLVIAGPVAATPVPFTPFTVGLRPVDSGLLNNSGQIEVPVCTTFDVELYFNGLSTYDFGNDVSGSPIGLVGINLGILWDPLVEFVSFQTGSTWPMLDVTPSAGPTVPLKVTINGINFSDPINSDHSIGIFTLHCIGAGLTDLIPFATTPASFALSDYTPIDNLIAFQGVTINQVPIPSSLFLLGGGLVGLIAYRRKAKN